MCHFLSELLSSFTPNGSCFFIYLSLFWCLYSIAVFVILYFLLCLFVFFYNYMIFSELCFVILVLLFCFFEFLDLFSMLFRILIFTLLYFIPIVNFAFFNSLSFLIFFLKIYLAFFLKICYSSIYIIFSSLIFKLLCFFCSKCFKKHIFFMFCVFFFVFLQVDLLSMKNYVFFCELKI